MKMHLHIGRVGSGITLDDLPTIDFPIIELDPAAYGVEIGNIVSSYNYDVTTASGTVNIKSISFSGTNNEIYDSSGNLSLLLTSAAPKFCTDEGNIITTQGGFVDTGNPRYEIPDLTFDTVPIGTRPSDFGINRYKYYLKQDTSVGWTSITAPLNYYSSIGVSDFNGYTMTDYNDAVFNTNVQYYKINNSDVTKDLCQVFTADNGTMFGVGKICSYRGSGNWHWSTFAGCMDSQGSQVVSDCCFYWHTYGLNDEHNISPIAGNSPRRIYIQYDARDRTVNPNVALDYNKTCIFFASVVYNDITYTGIIVVENSDDTENAIPIRVKMTLFSPEFWGEAIQPEDVPDTPWGDESTVEGGDGTYSAPSNDRGTGGADDVAEELAPMITALTSVFAGNGSFNIHHILPAATPYIMEVLYSTNFLMRYAQSMYDPISAILSMHLIPPKLVQDTENTTRLTASSYDISANMSAGSPATTFPEVVPMHVYHVGTVDISNYFGAYPDFSPYTECILHLPYVGTIKIDTNAIMYGKIAVYYACDAMSGNVCAWVWCKDKNGRCTYKYMATGNAAYNIPVFARNNSGIDVGKILGNIASSVFLGFAGSPVGAGLSAIHAGLSANPFVMPKSTIVEGTFGGNVGILQDDCVYLEIIRPQWANPRSYAEDKGIPTLISGSLESLGISGYVEIDDIDMEALTSTDAEKEELKKIMLEGFWYVTE